MKSKNRLINTSRSDDDVITKGNPVAVLTLKLQRDGGRLTDCALTDYFTDVVSIRLERRVGYREHAVIVTELRPLDERLTISATPAVLQRKAADSGVMVIAHIIYIL